MRRVKSPKLHINEEKEIHGENSLPEPTSWERAQTQSKSAWTSHSQNRYKMKKHPREDCTKGDWKIRSEKSLNGTVNWVNHPWHCWLFSKASSFIKLKKQAFLKHKEHCHKTAFLVVFQKLHKSEGKKYLAWANIVLLTKFIFPLEKRASKSGWWRKCSKQSDSHIYSIMYSSSPLAQ